MNRRARVTAAAREEELVTRACAETGLSDFGGDGWREGLEVLLRAALSEARFNAVGENMFYGTIVQTLVNRLQVEDWYTRYPEIDEQDVHVELLGVGFPRTGSTALAALLGEDHALRSLRTWEAPSPCPPPGVSSEADASRLAAARARIAGGGQMASRLRSMLPQSATGPTEDHDLMALEFKAQAFLVSARVPSYARWFLHCDAEPAYLYERRVLKLLQWRCPPHQWQLKSPTHTLFLDAFERVFPEARFVMTHRDVAEVLPSVCDLYATLLRIGSDGVDPHEVGELNLEQWGTALDRVLAFRDAGRDGKFFDVAFVAFQRDPIAQLHGLYEWLGRDFTDETQTRMRAWRDDNPRDKHGGHEYDGAEFGITAARLDERFARYRARFGSLL